MTIQITRLNDSAIPAYVAVGHCVDEHQYFRNLLNEVLFLLNHITDNTACNENGFLDSLHYLRRSHGLCGQYVYLPSMFTHSFYVS